MNFPLVTRKKYEVMQSNLKIVNSQRIKNDEFAILLQKKIIEKDEEIKNLKNQINNLKSKNKKLKNKMEV